jgi:hypothetical protein
MTVAETIQRAFCRKSTQSRFSSQSGVLDGGSAAQAEGLEIPPQLRCKRRSRSLSESPCGCRPGTTYGASQKLYLAWRTFRFAKKLHVPNTKHFHRENGPPCGKSSLLLVCQRGEGVRRPPSSTPTRTHKILGLCMQRGRRKSGTSFCKADEARISSNKTLKFGVDQHLPRYNT